MAIIEGGRSQYQIVTPGRFYPVENHAAEILQDALCQMTGVRLPVRWAHQRVPRLPAILLGEAATPNDSALWQKDSYEIAPRGQDLVLSGTPRRATHYAVHAFLESLGARFFGPENIVLPKLDRVALPEQSVRSTAQFSYRHVFYPTAQEPDWAIRWGLNVHDGRDARWGANASAHSFGHSFEALVPPAKHFAAHPEYFSLVDGQRRSHGEQLCCTNPNVAEVACETMAQWIAAHPDKRIFAVGMNDWLGWCECERCAAVDKREGGPTGQLLTLVNRVAERFPERIIATLAYSWAIDPPTAMPARDNVLIVLCHNAGCFSHALDGCEPNRKFLERLRGWKEKSKRILIWDYYVNYHSYLMPTPNFARIQRDFRTYRDLGIEAMFCQGSACRGGQFEGLRQYLQARLLWDPDLDAWAIIREWLDGVYGSASGGSILEYLQLLEQHVAENNVHMLSFGSGEEIQEKLFTPEILQRGKALWDLAECAAPDAQTTRKVFAARAPEMCARLFHAGMRYVIEDAAFKPAPPPDAALRERFVAAAIAADAAHLREDDAAPEDFDYYFGRSYPAVVLESPTLKLTAIPELGGRILSLFHKPANVELLRMIDPVRYVNYGPYDAGYEFSVEQRWHGKGTRAAYHVVEQTDSSVVLETRIDNLRLRTCYTLANDTVRIEHTVSNQGAAPASIAPCTHPEWSFAAFDDDAELRIRKCDGAWTTMPLNPQRRGGRDLKFAAAERPHGGWELVSGAQPLTMQESFDAEAVEAGKLCFSRGRNLNLEVLWTPRELAPGASAEFRTAWRIGGRG